MAHVSERALVCGHTDISIISKTKQTRKVGDPMLLVSKGDVVRLSEAADFRPYVVVPKGEKGTVVWIDREQGRADIKLHNEFPGLRCYDNCVWTAPDAPLPFKVVRKARTAQLMSDARGVIAGALTTAFMMGTGILVAGASCADEQLIAWIEAVLRFTTEH